MNLEFRMKNLESLVEHMYYTAMFLLIVMRSDSAKQPPDGDREAHALWAYRNF